MNYNLSNANTKLLEYVKTDGISLNTELILSSTDTNDNNVFLYSKYPMDTTIELNYDNLILNSEKQLIENIQNQIYLLTNINELKKLNNQIHTSLIENAFIPMATTFSTSNK